MKVIQLPDVLHEYLLGLIEMHAGRGIHPEEGLAVNRLWDAVKNRATHIDEGDIQKMAVAGGPDGQSALHVHSPRDPHEPDKTCPCDPKREIDPRNLKGQLPDGSGSWVPIECEKCFDEEGSQACIRPAHQTKQNV
jgi:hypothetical protein